MRYFTPELIARGQSEDDTVLDEVDAIWDARGAEYGRYLEGVKDRFPPSILHIENSYYLHDSTVLGIGRTADRFVFFLRLDWPPQSLLVFRYDVVEEPRIDRDALPEVARLGGDPLWLYDELELVEGIPPTWRQSILLSNGWEVTLHFRDVEVEEIQAILPVPRHRSSAASPELPRTA